MSIFVLGLILCALGIAFLCVARWFLVSSEDDINEALSHYAASRDLLDEARDLLDRVEAANRWTP